MPTEITDRPNSDLSSLLDLEKEFALILMNFVALNQGLPTSSVSVQISSMIGQILWSRINMLPCNRFAVVLITGCALETMHASANIAEDRVLFNSKDLSIRCITVRARIACAASTLQCNGYLCLKHLKSCFQLIYPLGCTGHTFPYRYFFQKFVQVFQVQHTTTISFLSRKIGKPPPLCMILLRN